MKKIPILIVTKDNVRFIIDDHSVEHAMATLSTTVAVVRDPLCGNQYSLIRPVMKHDIASAKLLNVINPFSLISSSETRQMIKSFIRKYN